jgi:hypothetical protein
MKQSSYELKLCGQKILLKAPDADSEVADQVLELVSRKLKEAEGRTSKSTAPHQVTLLALLDLAGEYIKAKQKTVEFKRRVGAKSAHLLGLIEANRR